MSTEDADRRAIAEARRLCEAGDDTAALGLLSEVIDRGGPGRAEAALLRAEIRRSHDLDDTRVVEDLELAVDSPDPTISILACETAGYVYFEHDHDRARAVELLERVVRLGSDDQRREASLWLGYMADGDERERLLREAMRHSDRYVRAEAAVILAEHVAAVDPVEARTLAELTLEHGESDDRQRAAALLQQLGEG